MNERGIQRVSGHDQRVRGVGQLRVVIAGAGFGGLEAAQALRNAPVHVTVIDRKNHFLFQPLLYQVATAALSPADISAPIRTVLKHQYNASVVMAEVVGVDTASCEVRIRDQVTGDERAVPYDYLILATGAGQSYFGHDEWAEYAPGLKSIPDATALRRQVLLAFEQAEQETDHERIRALLTFVIVGGGPTGVELAGAIAELAHHAIIGDFRHINASSARIILVEALPRILSSFPESLADKGARRLRQLGVEVWTNAPVEQVSAEGVVIHGEPLRASTVIWAAGVKASPAGEWIGAETDRAGRVKVRPDLSVPNHPNIFVIGDAATVPGPKGKPLPGIAPVAMQQGRYVGDLIRARTEGKDDSKPFRYFDKGNLAVLGRAYALADFGLIRLTGFVAWVLWLAVHIFYLVGFRNRLLVMIQWAWLYLTSQRSARLIVMEDESAAERKLLAGKVG